MTNTESKAHPGLDAIAVLRALGPELWVYRGRIALALAALTAAKLALIGVPVLLKALIDALDVEPTLLAVPVGLLLAYGAARLSATLFQELRQVVFARVMARTSRQIMRRVFEHLHALSLRFHLGRRTGEVARDVERGGTAISDLLDWTVYLILPTALELLLVLGILLWYFDWSLSAVVVATIIAYSVFTFRITEWRTRIYRAAVEADSQAAGRAVDSLLNYETVKYFGNEAHESQLYDRNLRTMEEAQVRSLKSLAVLNVGQSAIVAIGLSALLWIATVGVVEQRMSLGDLVMVNAFMLQLAAPLNYLGMVYREVKQALTNLERLYGLLDQPQEVRDPAQPAPLPRGDYTVRFEQVGFHYEPDREILRGVSFTIGHGQTVAVVGASGGGKSTLARLLFRFFDPTAGRITIGGADIRDLPQQQLRALIGIVPQDTVLFNDTLGYNLGYGRPTAEPSEVLEAARGAQLDGLLQLLPDGLQTGVGERGLKLSGGEKQRVAIARTLLKNPPILILDEATSALDSATEQAIETELHRLAKGRTALVIAHRLSTVMNADQIVVLERGRVIETGRHDALLAAGGAYAELWARQQRAQRDAVAIDG